MVRRAAAALGPFVVPVHHTCLTGASMAVLGALFPSRADELWGFATEAGISRIYGDIHYRFDADAG